MSGNAETGRRGFMLAAAGLAAAPLAGAQGTAATGSGDSLPVVEGRRRLGKLEVSSIGIGPRT